METRFNFWVLALTISSVTALNLGLFHFAVASQEPNTEQLAPPKTEPSHAPTVFARFAKPNAPGTAQVPPETLNGPAPTLASLKDAKGASTSKWLLPKSPTKLVWQQDLNVGQTLRVELTDNSGQIRPGQYIHSKNGQKESIEIIPSEALDPQTEMRLVADLFSEQGQRLEHWVLLLSISNSQS